MYSKPNIPLSKQSSRVAKNEKSENDSTVSSKPTKVTKEESDNSEDEGPQIMLSQVKKPSET